MSMRFEAKKKPVEIRKKSPAGKIVALAVAVLLLIAGSVWGVRETLESRRAAANLAEFQRMGELRKSDAYKDMTDEQKSQHRKDYFAKLNELTFEQRKKLMNEWVKEEQKLYDEYFSVPPDQRDAVLARQMAEQKSKWKGGGPPGRGRGGPGQGNNQAGKGGAGQGNPAGDAQAQKGREQRHRERLDMTTPEQRAQRSVYRQARRQAQQQGGGR